MANIKSQKKRILTNEKRRVRNQSVKSELKTLVRQTREPLRPATRTRLSPLCVSLRASWTSPFPRASSTRTRPRTASRSLLVASPRSLTDQTHV